MQIGSYYPGGQSGLGPEAYGHSCLFFLPDLGLGDLSLCMSYLGVQSNENLPASWGGCAILQLQSLELEGALDIIQDLF